LPTWMAVEIEGLSAHSSFKPFEMDRSKLAEM